jgi:uncharacterized linocin/CFP29 family protein
MQSLRRVGMDTGQLTDEEVRYIDARVVETVRPMLIGRRLFPVFRLPHAGFLKVRGYRESDMSEATISLHGQTKAKDRVELAPFDITVPVIHKEFTLYWRDVIASRNGGLPIETRTAENAARQCAEEEDKLLLTGEYVGWRALGVEGLATATNRNTTAGGAWPANAIANLSAAIAELESDGHQGPYALIARTAQLRKLWQLISNTAEFYYPKIAQMCRAGIYASDNLFTSAAATTSALVVEPSQENFEVVVGQDLAIWAKQDEDMNLQGKVFEVLAPRIKRPESICEITGLS